MHRAVVVAQARDEFDAIDFIAENSARDDDVGFGREDQGIPCVRNSNRRESVITQKLRIHFQPVVTRPLNEEDNGALSGGHRWSLDLVEPPRSGASAVPFEGRSREFEISAVHRKREVEYFPRVRKSPAGVDVVLREEHTLRTTSAMRRFPCTFRRWILVIASP